MPCVVGGEITKRVLLVLLAGVVVLAGCGGSGDSEPEGGNAHVNPRSGAINGAALDERVGTKPPPAKQTNLVKAAEEANCYLLRNYPAEEDKVISVSAPTPEYSKDPPMTGPRVAPPHQQADGAFLTSPDLPTAMASLNNGRMTIQYAPDLAEDLQLELKGLYDTMYGGTLFFPNSTMHYAVAATTWSNSLDCPGFQGPTTLDAIRAFGKATWGKYGSEPVDKFPVEGPTPANPKESRATGSG
jgi:hypothetical protein